MNDKVRGFLGFLGLIEDEYGEYGSTGAAPARPFSEQTTGQSDAEWSPPTAERQFPTSATTSTPMRPTSSPSRTTSISVLDSSGQAPRIRPMQNATGSRGVSSFSQERDV